MRRDFSFSRGSKKGPNLNPLRDDLSLPTCSDVHVPRLDAAEGVLGHAAIGLCVNLLLVVRGPEGG